MPDRGAADQGRFLSSARGLKVELAVAAMTSMFALTACSGGPEPILPPEWDPPEQAAQAMSELDADGDGALDSEELAKAPGLAAGVASIDLNRDGKLTAEEILARFELFREKGITFRARQFRVTYRGRPLADAQVRFVPEPFLEGVVESAEGTTDVAGAVTPTAGVEGILGMRPGYYRVEVTSPHIKLPAKFNAATTLGAEVTMPSDSEDPYGAVELRLVD
jgi:hypothetical protein